MVLVVFCTFPDEASAAGIVRTLVEEKLAACGNIIPGVRSIYAWEGRVEDASEVLVVFKTTGAVYAKLEKRLAKLHPHDIPEILALEAGAAARAYAAWVAACTDAS